MERGKRICKILKELRKRIADANEIPYKIEEIVQVLVQNVRLRYATLWKR